MGDFGQVSACGTLIVEALSSTQFKFTPGVFTGSGDCRLECQNALAGDPVTLDVTCLTSPSMTTICASVGTPIPFGPQASANQNCGTSPLNCFTDAEVQWSAVECCPTSGGGDSGGGDSGGGDSGGGDSGGGDPGDGGGYGDGYDGGDSGYP